jgi:hypothetical protein
MRYVARKIAFKDAYVKPEVRFNTARKISPQLRTFALHMQQ